MRCLKKNLKNDKRGFTLIYSLMLGVLFFALALAIAPALHDTTSEASSTSLLNCSNASSLSNQDKSVCTSIDIQQLYIPIIFGFVGIIVGGIAIR